MNCPDPPLLPGEALGDSMRENIKGVTDVVSPQAPTFRCEIFRAIGRAIAAGISLLTTKGDLLTHDGDNLVRLGLPTDVETTYGYILTADPAEETGLKWIPGRTAIAISGAITGEPGQVAWFNEDSEIDGDDDFFWDEEDKTLAIGMGGAAAAGRKLQIGGQFEATGAQHRFGSLEQQTTGAEFVAVGQSADMGADGGNAVVLYVGHDVADGEPATLVSSRFRKNADDGSAVGSVVEAIKREDEDSIDQNTWLALEGAIAIVQSLSPEARQILSRAGGTEAAFELGPGEDAQVSTAGNVAFRSNAGVAEVSENGGDWEPLGGLSILASKSGTLAAGATDSQTFSAASNTQTMNLMSRGYASGQVVRLGFGLELEAWIENLGTGDTNYKLWVRNNTNSDGGSGYSIDYGVDVFGST